MAERGGYWTFKARSRHRRITVSVWLEAVGAGAYIATLYLILTAGGRAGLLSALCAPPLQDLLWALLFGASAGFARLLSCLLPGHSPAHKVTIQSRGIKIERASGKEAVVRWDDIRWIGHSPERDRYWSIRTTSELILLASETFTHGTWDALNTRLSEYLPAHIQRRHPWRDPRVFLCICRKRLTPVVTIVAGGTAVLALLHGNAYLFLAALVPLAGLLSLACPKR